ncbi:MAG: methylated-DNA--[protein]-cysteine S-methyltransferase [Burkholderiaceae bacterium]
MKQHHILQQRIASPLGWLTATRSARGISGLWFDGQKHHPGALDLPLAAGDPLLSEVEHALATYFQGQVLPAALLRRLDPQGTPFQRAVWQALLAIPPGASDSYGGLARRVGRPLAARAVGASVGRNPVSILIPCHRALGAAGQLTGYAGGLDRKIALLRLEGAHFSTATPAAA